MRGFVILDSRVIIWADALSLSAFRVASVCRRGGCAHRGMVLFWGSAAVLALGLAMGRYSWLYEGFFQIPIFNNIRAPIKFLDNMQIALGILAGFGVDALTALRRVHVFVEELGSVVRGWRSVCCSVCGACRCLKRGGARSLRSGVCSPGGGVA